MLSFRVLIRAQRKPGQCLNASVVLSVVIFFLALAAAVEPRAAFSQSAYPSTVHDVEGELEILHEDGDRGGRYHYFLKTADGQRITLNFAKQPPRHLLSGSRVRARGERTNGVLALQSGADDVQTVAAASANALGERRTLVILVNFRNDDSQPYTTASANDVVFGTTNDFFLENSYQQTFLSGVVKGWYQIDMNRPADNATCDYGQIASRADAAAAAAGVALSSYSHKVYAFPQTGCSWWGLSSVGGNPSQSWINGRLELGVAAHELGHGLGLWHSHSLDCGGNAVIGAGCSVNEYGDIVDMMGASQAAHYNAFQKERLGWLNAASSPPITTVNMAGSYTLGAYESMISAPKALKILRSTDAITSAKTWFYVEARKAFGFDGFLANEPSENVTAGVLIRTGTDGNGDSSLLLDMTPATPVYYWWYDPALGVGQSFTDSSAGVTMTVNSVDSSGAIVTVSFAASVTVTTDEQSYDRGQTVTVSARVSTGGVGMPKTPVSFTVKKSNGALVKATVTTGSNGIAVYKLRLTKKDPLGTYEATATAAGTSATTYFTVR